MINGYLLITTASGREKDVLTALRKIKDVETANIVYGEYDIIVKIRSQNSQKLNEFVTAEIRKIAGIQNTYTLISS